MGIPARRWCRNEFVHVRRAADRVVVLADSDEPRTLRGTGAALWDVFDSPRTLSEAAVVLSGQFSSDPEAVEADIAPVVDELERVGALRVVE
ncbi:MAG: PqqD family protein [Acidimicrobiia bacterium]|nr:PqqD family protein [Acidimicrobiia bacterium]